MSTFQPRPLPNGSPHPPTVRDDSLNGQSRKRAHSQSDTSSQPNGTSHQQVGSSISPQAGQSIGLAAAPPSRPNNTRPPTQGTLLTQRDWNLWPLVQEGIIQPQQADIFFNFFATHLAPLYPLIPARHFLPIHFPALATDDPLLLTALVAVAARFSPLGPPTQNAPVHAACAAWIRHAVVSLLDGSPRFRSVGTVEALLMLSEWPMVAVQKDGEGGDGVGALVGPIEEYDAFAWSYVGRPAIIHQDCLTSTWWETISRLASLRSAEARVAGEVWDDDIAQGLIAALMATIQDRVFYDTGLAVGTSGKPLWEESLEGLIDELDYIKANCKRHMPPNTVNGSMFAIELEYAAVYAHTLPLRALQCKLRLGKKPRRPLLSLPEGAWLIKGFESAQAILTHATSTLAPRSFLRLAPGRTLSRILFAATFLFKLLALGVLPPADGWARLSALLGATFDALDRARVDSGHLAGAVAALLKRVPVLTRVPQAASGEGEGGAGREEWKWDPREGCEEAVGALDGVIERLGGGRAAGVWGALEGREKGTQ